MTKQAPGSASRGQRLAMMMIGTGVAIVAIALLVMKLTEVGPWAPTLNGAIINPPSPAPDFTLHDQFDRPVSLSSFRGKVVVLTFLYTNCPDACPLITEKLHQAYALLGPDASRTAILAVTVDPERDTVQQVRSYSARKDMLDKWHFLVGTVAQVQPVWTAYGAASARDDLVTGQAKATAVAAGVPTPGQAMPGSYVVDHSAPIFLIDPSGQARAILDIGFTPADLVQDVRALLR